MSDIEDLLTRVQSGEVLEEEFADFFLRAARLRVRTVETVYLPGDAPSERGPDGHQP